MTPKVSVVIPTRNSPATLRRALESIRRQDFEDYEVLVMDDGSTGDVREQYRSWWGEFDDRFRLDLPPLPNLPGQRQSATRNRGIRLARGEFVAFLDHDDLWIAKDHLSVAIQTLVKRGADYYFANMQSVRGSAVLIADHFAAAPRLSNGIAVLDEPRVCEVPLRNCVEMLRHQCVHVNTTVLCRSLVHRIGGFTERLNYFEDVDFMFRAVDQAGCVLYRPDVVAQYTLPDGGCLTLAQTELERALQGLYACINARAVCRQGPIRQCARAQEAWVMRRRLAPLLAKEHRYFEACQFLFEAACVCPTFGALSDIVRCISGAVRAALFCKVSS